MVVNQQKNNTDIPKTQKYGRIPTKDAVFKQKHARVLLPTKVKDVHHSETVTNRPQELSVYAEMENTGQEKELPRKKHIDDNVAGMSKNDVQSTSTKTSSRKFVCQYCGKHFVSSSYRWKHEEQMCSINPNRKSIQIRTLKKHINMNKITEIMLLQNIQELNQIFVKFAVQHLVIKSN